MIFTTLVRCDFSPTALCHCTHEKPTVIAVVKICGSGINAVTRAPCSTYVYYNKLILLNLLVINVYIAFSIITNSCTHSSIFIKNTLKVNVKFTPTCFGSQMEPSSGGQQLILAKVYKWFNGASPYSHYCGGIRKPMCVYC